MPFKNLDFLNANTLRNYPIKEGLTKKSMEGLFIIPDNFIVDLILCASSDVSTSFYVSKISNFSDNISIEISDNANSICGSFSINPSSHQLYQEYILTASSDYPEANGRITIADVTTVRNLPDGTYSFTLESTEFETRTIIPSLTTATSLSFVNAQNESFTFTNRIKLYARNNLRFRVSGDSVILDAGDGLGLNKNCNSAPYIKTINNQSPDSNGNFTIIPADCASLTALVGTVPGLMLSDTCCKPCMGCEEISTLTERLMQIESDLLLFRDHYEQLQALTNQFSTLIGYSCEC